MHQNTALVEATVEKAPQPNTIDVVDQQRSVEGTSYKASNGSYICVTEYISEDTSLADLFDRSISETKCPCSAPQMGNMLNGASEICQLIFQSHSKPEATSLMRDTHYNDHHRECNTHCQKYSGQSANHVPSSITMTGLHTCGDLASASMKLFIDDDHVQNYVAVGCCYHLLTERFSEGSDLPFPTTPSNENSAQMPKDEGKIYRTNDTTAHRMSFPMSAILISQRYTIGRNARMISCQPPARLEKGEVSFTTLLVHNTNTYSAWLSK